MRRFCARPQMEMWLKIPVGVIFFWFWDFLQNLNYCLRVLNVKVLDWNFKHKWCTFQYPKGQMGKTSLKIVRFQNFNHHYKWENVYFNIIIYQKLNFDDVHITDVRVSFWQNGSHIYIILFCHMFKNKPGIHNNCYWFTIRQFKNCQASVRSSSALGIKSLVTFMQLEVNL